MAILLAWIRWDRAEIEPRAWSTMRAYAQSRSPFQGSEHRGPGWNAFTAPSNRRESELVHRMADGQTLLLDRATDGRPCRPPETNIDDWLLDSTPCAAIRIEPQTRRLTVWRDLLGQRNLVYARVHGGLIVASHESILCAHREVGSELDLNFLAAFFAALPPAHDESAFRLIRTVAAGEKIQFEQSGESRQRRRLTPTDAWRGLNDDQICEHMGQLLQQSVQRSCIGASRIGLSLSAGLDSSAVAAALVGSADLVPEQLLAVSYSFPSWPQIDERALVEQSARHLRLPLRYFDADSLDPLAEHLHRPVNPDTPIASIYREIKEGSYAEFANAEVQVWLDGNFGDHLFASNNDWIGAGLKHRRWSQLGAEAGWRLSQGAWRRPWRDSGLRALARDLVRRGLVLPPRVADLQARFAERFAEHWAADLQAYQEFPRPNQAMSYCNGYAMAVSDGERFYAMRHSMEQCSPFRDVELARWMLSIPADLLQRQGKAKWLLRHWLRERVPPVIAERPKSSDLTPFMQASMDRQGERWADLSQVALPFASQVLSAQALEQRDPNDASLLNWLLASLGLWLQSQDQRNCSA